MARAIVNDFGKSACYVSIGNLTSNLYIREVAESVQASVNAAIDEKIAAALSGKLVLEKHDCGPDTQRPKDMEIVLVNTDENFYVMRYDQEYFHTRNFETIISFADADYWCRLKGVK